MDIQPLHFQVRNLPGVAVNTPVNKQVLEQRRDGGIAHGIHRLHNLFKRYPIIGECIDGDIAHPLQYFLKIGLAGKVGAHDQRVDKQPDHIFGAGVIAPAAGRTDQNIVLSAIAVQQQLPGRQQYHEGGDGFSLGQFLHGRPDGCRQLEAHQATAEVRPQWPRVVGREIQRFRRGGELRTPEIQLRGQHRTVIALPAPVGVIAKLQIERCQRRRLVVAGRVIQGSQFTEENCRRPDVVVDDVIEYQREDGGALTQAQQRGLKQRTPLQILWLRQQLPANSQCPTGAFGFFQPGQIRDIEPDWLR